MKNEIIEAEKSSLEWLRISHLKANQNGFSHSKLLYLPSFISWRAPYPETTGYIIENFLNFNEGILNDGIEIGIHSADWLLSIQSPDGYYFSGLRQKEMSSFNTSQIIFGLREAFLQTKNIKYQEAFNKSKSWLITQIDFSGLWTKGLYQNNYFASYYSRAIWPLMYIATEDEKKILKKSIQILWDKKNKKYSFIDSGFKSGDNALTHTIAYAIEGFYECSILIDNSKMKSECLDILHFIAEMIKKDHALHGIYNDSWKVQSKMKCVTGQAQFTSLFAKAYSETNQMIFKETAIFLMNELLQWQVKSNSSEHHGAFTASRPIYSSYFPCQYVNWTNKFFLDACYYLKQIL